MKWIILNLHQKWARKSDPAQPCTVKIFWLYNFYDIRFLLKTDQQIHYLPDSTVLNEKKILVMNLFKDLNYFLFVSFFDNAMFSCYDEMVTKVHYTT